MSSPILPNWGIQYEWLQSVGFWDAWLALPADYVRREKIPDGERGCLTDSERNSIKRFKDLQCRMTTMRRPWDAP